MKGIIIINQNSLYNKIVAFLFAVYAFIGLNPYFLWSTYRNGIFSNVHGISTEALLGMVLIFATAYGVFTKNNRIKKDDVVLIIFTIVLTLYIMLLSGGILHNVKNGLWIRFFILICFFFQPIQIRAMSYRVYLTIFALTAVLPIIFYVLSNIGISIKYEKLKSYEPIKINKFYYYKHYPFASQIANVYSPEIERRLSGIYDEAGRLGTMAAMFLCSENYNLKKTNNKIIFVAGVLSFSLAFYIMSFVYFMLKCLEKRKIKSVLLILALVGAYFIFT